MKNFILCEFEVFGKEFFRKNLIFFLPLFFLSFSSCDKIQNATQDTSCLPNEGLSLCISSDVNSLDPRFGVDATSSQVIKMLFEGLMYINPEGKVCNAIAESYEISEDKKTYIFHLRDCHWSNGMDITAYDFEYSWKSIIDNCQKDRSMAVHNFHIIKNVHEYLMSKCSLGEIGVRALDTKTLEVQLESPAPYFLEAVTNTWFFPVSRVVDQTNPLWRREFGKQFVCSGPFQLKEHKMNNEILLEKNPLFWDAKQVGITKASISVVKDNMTRLCLFEKGSIDWLGRPLSGISLDACAILKKENKICLAPSYGIYWYFFNTERFPFTNKKMRLAFAFAVDREEITDFVLQSDEKPAHTVLPFSYRSPYDSQYKQDRITLSKKLFKEALAELGIKRENLPELSISYNTDETHQNVAQIIQHQIFSTLGVKVKLRHSEWKVHYSDLSQGDYCIGGMMWHSWVKDPMYILQTFRFRDDGINMSRWQDEIFQQILLFSDQETSPLLRLKLLQEAHEVLMQEMPVIPIYYTTIAYSKSDRLKNTYILENSMLDFRHAYLQKETLRY